MAVIDSYCTLIHCPVRWLYFRSSCICFLRNAFFIHHELCILHGYVMCMDKFIYFSGLGVSDAVLDEINTAYQTEEKKEATSWIMYRWPPGREWQEHFT